MNLHVMTVTPELAKAWLAKNGKNRRISQVHVNRLADAMKHGRWVLNGQTVSFDLEGRLLDGQHRLSAVVESGQTIQMAVAVGVSDDEAFKSYDGVALKRGANQVATVMGVKNANRTAAIARVIMAWESAKSMEEFARDAGRGGQSPYEVAEKAEEISEEAHAADEMIGGHVASKSGSRATLVAMVMLFNRVDPVATSTFCHKLKTGIVDGENDPVLLLRDRLLSGQRGKGGNSWRPVMMALTIKAFNAHRTGRKLKNLRWRTEGDQPESFPRIEGARK